MIEQFGIFLFLILCHIC